jgi:hypothetical protein
MSFINELELICFLPRILVKHQNLNKDWMMKNWLVLEANYQEKRLSKSKKKKQTHKAKAKSSNKIYKTCLKTSNRSVPSDM